MGALRASVKRLGEENLKNGTWAQPVWKECRQCRTLFHVKMTKMVFCTTSCRMSSYSEKAGWEKQKYRRDCAFNFCPSDYPDKFDLDLVRQYGWYKATNNGNNINGVSKDHMLSVMDGFYTKIPPEIVGHPANCRLMVQRQNTSKGAKSIITLDELQERIRRWEEELGVFLPGSK